MSRGEALVALFGELPVVGEWVDGGDVADDVSAPFPQERALLSSAAAPARVRSFILGRLAAHAALRRAGAPAQPLLAGKDRAPRWPAGFVGSIAHTADVAAAVVARARDLAGLGVDVESARALASELWSRIATSRELAWLEQRQPAERGFAALQLFCAKEAVYKAWYPMGGRVLEFADVEVAWNEAGVLVGAEVQAAPAARFELRVVVLATEWMLAAAWRRA